MKVKPERRAAFPRQQAEDVLQQVRSGADFAEMAKQYSEDTSADQGGSLGLFGRVEQGIYTGPRIRQAFGKRVGDELGIPIYLYEHAATSPRRRNLAKIREGEYEGLEDKLRRPEWKPDFGPAEFRPRAGATVVGARDFLVAYNVNLNTRYKKIASDIALDVKEAGRAKRDAAGTLGDGGTIVVDNAPEGGAVFTVRLPV